MAHPDMPSAAFGPSLSKLVHSYLRKNTGLGVSRPACMTLESASPCLGLSLPIYVVWGLVLPRKSMGWTMEIRPEVLASQERANSFYPHLPLPSPSWADLIPAAQRRASDPSPASPMGSGSFIGL